MPPRKTRTKAVALPEPENIFATNASAFAPFAESISAIGTSRHRITAFGPASAAPPAMSKDTDTGSEEFVYKTLYDAAGNEVIIRTPVANRLAMPIIADDVTQTRITPSPTLATAAAQRRAQAGPTNSCTPSCSNSRRQSRGCSRTCSAVPADDELHQEPGPNEAMTMVTVMAVMMVLLMAKMITLLVLPAEVVHLVVVALAVEVLVVLVVVVLAVHPHRMPIRLCVKH